MSSNLRIEPKGLALGIAEGTILYKFTFLLHAPLELWLIVQLFRRHRRATATTASSPCHLAANQLAYELMAHYREAFGIIP
mmetsp:Transcript_91220/g.254002  ORF Transcript_91220/g.254002 Transcript_91220/m.254002 type:complete len:81 (+) Transcript_91220:710-952(+)